MAAFPSMAAFPTWPPSEPLTKYAEIYGHPPIGQLQNPLFSHAVLKGIVPLKSGYTPLEKSQFQTTQEYDDLSTYQRVRFLGFTAAELDVMEALALTSAKGPSIELPEVELHPCLRRPLWGKPLPKHLAIFPMRNGMTGNWEASNTVVWETILPSLYLASRFLSSAETLSWWDAILCGEYKDISDDAIEFDKEPKGVDDKYLQFFRLDPPTSDEPNRRQKVQDKFSEISKILEWHIISCHTDAVTGLAAEHSFGVTAQQNPEQDIRVHVGFELIEPLLNPDISSAERMICQFKLTCTIIHELAHAVWMSLRESHNVHSECEIEPYFEDEAIGELGLSMENAVFGGLERAVTDDRKNPAKGAPMGGEYLGNWICKRQTDQTTQSLLKAKPQDWDIYDAFPIPVDHFFNLHSNDFWIHHVRKWGPTSTHLQPKFLGSRFRLGNDQPSVVTFDSKANTSKDVVIDPSTMTEQDIFNAELENTRRRQNRRILDALVKDAKNKDAEDDIKMVEAILKSLALSNPDISSSSDVSDEDVDYVPPQCPRLDEIYDYLCAKRKELALDSLHFSIPEHLLYAYITREGGLDLSIDEWRGFLIRCHADGELFRYKPIGVPPTTTEGLITRISLGWPSTRLPPSNLPPPTALELEMFDAATTKIMKIDGVLHDKDHFDYDKDLFRRLANHVLKEMTFNDGNGQSQMGGSLSEEQFDRCIAEYERKGEKFCFGPKGVIRKLPLKVESESESGSGSGSGSESGSGSGSDSGSDNGSENGSGGGSGGGSQASGQANDSGDGNSGDIDSDVDMDMGQDGDQEGSDDEWDPSTQAVSAVPAPSNDFDGGLGI